MAEVGEIYPGTGERIVGKIPNPSGPGFYLQGEYGGVFAEGGAPYLGSYFDPALAGARNDPDRRFTGIEAIAGGGYRSISATPGEAGYAFAPQAAPAAATTPAALTPAQQRAAAPGASSAKGELVGFLHQYGLPASLADQLWDNDYIRDGKPISTIINVVLPNTIEYKTRFPGITALRERQNRGEAVLIPTPEEYLQLEAGMASVLRDAGLPPDFYDKPDDFTKWIGGSTSPKEVNDRINYARTVAFNLPVETREELNRIYDIDEGELVAFVLDPTTALEKIQKRIQTAGVGGAARRVGFGLLTRQEMEQLSGSGVTEVQAGERFGALVPQAGLFEETAEETMTGEELGRTEQVGFAGGSAESLERIERRRRSRAAQFQGGGGAGGGGTGRTGLGSS